MVGIAVSALIAYAGGKLTDRGENLVAVAKQHGRIRGVNVLSVIGNADYVMLISVIAAIREGLLILINPQYRCDGTAAASVPKKCYGFAVRGNFIIHQTGVGIIDEIDAFMINMIMV